MKMERRETSINLIMNKRIVNLPAVEQIVMTFAWLISEFDVPSILQATSRYFYGFINPTHRHKLYL